MNRIYFYPTQQFPTYEYRSYYFDDNTIYLNQTTFTDDLCIHALTFASMIMQVTDAQGNGMTYNVNFTITSFDLSFLLLNFAGESIPQSFGTIYSCPSFASVNTTAAIQIFPQGCGQFFANDSICHIRYMAFNINSNDNEIQIGPPFDFAAHPLAGCSPSQRIAPRIDYVLEKVGESIADIGISVFVVI